MEKIPFVERKHAHFARYVSKEIVFVKGDRAPDPSGDTLDVVDPYVTLGMSDGSALSFFANGWPVYVIDGDPISYDGFGFLHHHTEEELISPSHDVRVRVNVITFFWTKDRHELLSIGIGSTDRTDEFEISLLFIEDEVIVRPNRTFACIVSAAHVEDENGLYMTQIDASGHVKQIGNQHS